MLPPSNQMNSIPEQNKKKYMSNILKLLLKEKSRNSLWILINLKKSTQFVIEHVLESLIGTQLIGRTKYIYKYFESN